jgi:hypothetical protein
MRAARRAFLIGAILLCSSSGLVSAQSGTSQQTPAVSPPPATDAQALGILQQTFAALGNVVPNDSTATGTVTTTAGSRTENGSILIQTRGSTQSLEQLQTPSGSTIIYSNGAAAQIQGSASNVLSFELSLSSQSADFPLPIIGAALINPDTYFQYIGLETLNGRSVLHVQFWNSYASVPLMQSYSSFTTKDVWVDASTFLPARISYAQRTAGGSAPSIAIDVFYSNYQNSQGYLYPFAIQRSFNGTPFATITIQSVSFNTGLTDANFQVQ